MFETKKAPQIAGLFNINKGLFTIAYFLTTLITLEAPSAFTSIM
jgi:hypothetical protein